MYTFHLSLFGSKIWLGPFPVRSVQSGFELILTKGKMETRHPSEASLAVNVWRSVIIAVPPSPPGVSSGEGSVPPPQKCLII